MKRDGSAGLVQALRTEQQQRHHKRQASLNLLGHAATVQGPVQGVNTAEPMGYRFLDSFSELCEIRNAELEGLYLGRWYRAAVTGVDGAGVHLVYLESEDTEVLRPRAGKSFPYWPLACTGLRILSRILSL